MCFCRNTREGDVMKFVFVRASARPEAASSAVPWFLVAALLLGLCSSAAAAPTPSAPQDLVATAVSSTEVQLTWADPPGNEDSYTVERSVSGSSGFQPIATVAGYSTSYRDTGLAPATTYYYRAFATNKKGDSPYSNTASATTEPTATVPASPSGLSATPVSSSQIGLTWTDNSNNEDGFGIERSLSPSSGFAQIATVGANVSSYANTGLSPNTTYYYRVRAYNAAGNSGYSNTASATTQSALSPPAAPSGLSASAVSSSQIDLAWADNSSNEGGFKVERSLSSTSGFAQIATVGANVTSYSNSGLAPNTTYYYRVRAYNAAGNSAYSNTASATTGPAASTVPAAPSDLTATGAIDHIHLTWADNSSNEDNFDLWRKQDGSYWLPLVKPPANTTSYADYNVLSGVIYSYAIRAQNEVGSSDWSNYVSASVADPGTAPPSAPSGLSASAVSSTQINLSWTDNSGNEDGFKIERSLSAASGFLQIAAVGANVTTYSDTGVGPDTTYYYRVCAYNEAASSAYSNTASATTSQVVPAPPTNLTAAPASTSEIDLSWTDNADNESGFKVERSLSATSGFSQVAVVGENVTSHRDTGLSPGTAYCYRVRAYNGAGNSAYSNVAMTNTFDTPPAPPTGLTATAVSSSQIDLAWVDNADNEDSFDIERSLSAGSGFAVVASVGANVTSYQDTGLNASTTYYYKVRARNTAGASGYSATVSATTGTQTTVPLGAVLDVVVDGAYAFVASSQYGLVTVDVSDPTNPRGIAAAAVGFTPSRVAVDGSLAVLGGGYGGIAVVDISDPLAPVLMGSLGLYAFDVQVSAGFAYVTAGGPGRLDVVDLAHPSNPVLIATLPVEGNSYGIAVAGQYAYIAGGTALVVVDISIPDDPQVVGSVPAYCQRVVAGPDYAYIDGEWGGGVQIVDIADPRMPEVVGHHPMAATPLSLADQDGILYVVFQRPDFNQKGLHLADVSDPASPFPTAVDVIDGSPCSVAASGQYAYLGDWENGLLVFDVSDPYDPILVGTAQ
jgi:phosphodiesterase/alkaline phosphatase D-like protein